MMSGVEPSHDDTPRRPRSDGHEPEIQLSFANERTFLAWERTALGPVTAGLAITQLLPSFDFPGGRRLIGLPLIALGTVIALMSLRVAVPRMSAPRVWRTDVP
jgi:putative membrane protein